MIRQEFGIPRLGWRVRAYYAVDDCWTEEILGELEQLGANAGFNSESCAMLNGGMLNQGLTYANYRQKRALVVIGITTSAEEFHNTYEHEKRHLVEFIAEAERIPTHGEEISYLDGYVAGRMFQSCKGLMCECCREKTGVR